MPWQISQPSWIRGILPHFQELQHFDMVVPGMNTLSAPTICPSFNIGLIAMKTATCGELDA